MFCRPLWDPEMLELGKKFYMTEVAPKNKPGFRLTDQALVNAAWHLENSFAHGVSGGRMGMYAWEWDGIFDYPPVPPGLKIDTASASWTGAGLILPSIRIENKSRCRTHSPTNINMPSPLPSGWITRLYDIPQQVQLRRPPAWDIQKWRLQPVYYVWKANGKAP